MSDFRINKPNSYSVTLSPPPDKSISVRAALLGAIAHGTTTVHNMSHCRDARAALDAVALLGANIVKRGRVTEVTSGGLNSCEIDCRNSATTARLLCGILAGAEGEWTLYGDESLSRRPMARVIEPLKLMGAEITSSSGTLPIKIKGRRLVGIDYTSPVISAQVKSAVLLAGLTAGDTVFIERAFTRDHTERMIMRMGGQLIVYANSVAVKKGELRGCEIIIPGDISAAVYPAVLAVALGGRCTLNGVGLNSSRTAIIRVLRSMGAEIDVDCKSTSYESYGNITVKAGKAIKPLHLDEKIAPFVIDEIPALCALACFADGVSTVRGASELRHKESDRISSLCAMLTALGIKVEERADGLDIHGGKANYAEVDSCGDHRIAMAAAVAMAAGAGGTVKNGECVSVSYPRFFDEVIDV